MTEAELEGNATTGDEEGDVDVDGEEQQEEESEPDSEPVKKSRKRKRAPPPPYTPAKRRRADAQEGVTRRRVCWPSLSDANECLRESFRTIDMYRPILPTSWSPRTSVKTILKSRLTPLSLLASVTLSTPAKTSLSLRRQGS